MNDWMTLPGALLLFALMLAAGTAAVIGLYLGFNWHDMEEAMVKGITLALKACLILLAVGSLIGSWMLAGTAMSTYCTTCNRPASASTTAPFKAIRQAFDRACFSMSGASI